MADLPSHLTLGRSSFAGPVSGGYASFVGQLFTDVGTTATDAITFAFKMPADFRVMTIIVTTPVGAPSNTCDFRVYKHSSIAVSGATQMTTTSGGSQTSPAVIDWDALGGSFSVLPPGAGGDADLVTTARDVDRGDFIFGATTTTGTGDTSAPHAFTVTGFFRGHPTINPDFD